jgi:hypothetical protein
MVTIDDDLFIKMLWDRVNEFCPDAFTEDFWNGVFEYLKEGDWLQPGYNDPMYIVDNIYVNGEITPVDEVADNYDLEGQSVEEFMENNGFVIADYFIMNLGL